MTSNTALPLSLLIVDDEAGIRHGLKLWFQEEFHILESSDYAGAIAIAQNHSLDVAIVDIRLQENRNGMDLFHKLQQIHPGILVILLTGFGNIEDAVDCMKSGAADYLLKPVDNNKLQKTIQDGLELRNLRQENRHLKQELAKKGAHYHFITQSKVMLKIQKKADKIKTKQVPVLITGASGTGKEVLARYIHYTSSRSHQKLVVFNCAAISENLVLSELFGHEKGSFTGAHARQIGRFEQAHQGTLFMDEIGDLSLSNQVALLRVLETQQFERVGGKETLTVDVRIIAATNKNLKALVEQGQYREDLFYRINVINLDLPALKERKADIPLLVEHFIQFYNRKYKKHVMQCDSEALQAFMQYSWPGNIRELSNVINQAVLLNDKKVIGIQDIEYEPISGPRPALMVNGFDELKMPSDFSDAIAVRATIEKFSEQLEKKMLNLVLQKNYFNKSKTAAALNISRKTLSNKIKKYQIPLKEDKK